jgi:hypothetical protein
MAEAKNSPKRTGNKRGRRAAPKPDVKADQEKEEKDDDFMGGMEEDDVEEEVEEEEDVEEEDDEDDDVKEDDDDLKQEEDDALSGCDPTMDYHPFAQLPDFKSHRYPRELFFSTHLGKGALRAPLNPLLSWVSWGIDYFEKLTNTGIDPNTGLLATADQSMDESDPLSLPVVVRFTKRCVRQSESELGQHLILVILGHDNAENLYVMYYGGARVLDHVANVGQDEQVYPYPSLRVACQTLSGGTTTDAWKSFVVQDKVSPHDCKTLSSLRIR